MKFEFYKFLKSLFILSAAIGIIGIALYNYVIPQYYLTSVPISFIFFILVTSITHYILMTSSKKGTRFVSFFMGTFTAKILLYMAVMMGYIWFNKETALPFIIMFGIFYIIFTVFEVLSILKYLKESNPKTKTE